MADQLPVVIDSIGRTVEIEATQWSSLKDKIKDGMADAVSEMKGIKTALTTVDIGKTQEIAQLLSGLTKFKDELNNVVNTMNDVADSMKATGGSGSGSSSGVLDLNKVTGFDELKTGIVSLTQSMQDALGEDFKASIKNINDIHKVATGTSGLFTSDQKTHHILEGIKRAIEDCCSGMASAAPTVKNTEQTVPTSSADPNNGMDRFAEVKKLMGSLVDETKAQDNLTAARQRGRGASKSIADALDEENALIQRGNVLKNHQVQFFGKLIGYVQKAEHALFGLEKGMNLFDSTIDGVVQNEQAFIRDTRAAAYEIQGITGDTHGLQDAMTDIGKTVAATGFNRTDFQAQYLKALKSGIKDQKTAIALTTTQLNTEKQLGMAAGDLGDTFIKMKNEYNMSNMQIAEMGRGMRDVARYTGLTGQALGNAVKSADAIVMMLRNAAQLSSAAAKNVMELTANAQKMGVGEQVSKLTKAMSSTVELYMNASTETQAFLFQAASRMGRVADLQQGTIMKTKAGMKDMKAGMEKVLKDYGVESMEAIDNLSDSVKMQLNLKLKVGTGFELGEIQQTMKAFDESTKTLADRLEAVRKKQQGNLNIEEKLAAKEEERRLKQSAAFAMLTALDEAAKGAKDMNAALGQFGKRQKDFEGDLKAMGKSWGNSGQAARGAIEEALKGVNESLKGSGKSELKIDSSEIDKAMKDPAAFRDLTAKLTKAEHEANTAQKAALDPMSKIDQGVKELNDTLRNMSSHMLSGFANLTGVVGLLIPALGLMAAEQGMEIARFVKGFQDAGSFGGLINGMKNAFGFGKKNPEKASGDKANAAATAGGAGEKKKGLLGGMLDKTKEVVGGSPAKDAAGVAGGPAIMKVQDDALLKLTGKIHGVLSMIQNCLCNPKAKRIEKAEYSQIKENKAANDSLIKQADSGAAGGDGIADKLNAQLNSLKTMGGKAIEKFTENLKGMKEKIAKTVDGMGETFSNLKSKMSATASKVGGVFKDLSSKMSESASKVGGVFKDLSGKMSTTAGKVGVVFKDLSGKMSATAGKVGETFKDMSKKGTKAIGGLTTKIKSFVTKAEKAGGDGAKKEKAPSPAPKGEDLTFLDKIEKMKKDIPRMAKAGAIIAAISVVIVLLGAVLLGMAKMLFTKTGLTIGSVMETAAIIAVIVGGAALIAWALDKAQPRFKLLDKLAKKAPKMFVSLMKGVFVFGMLMIPLIALAAAIALFGKIVIDGFGLTPGRILMIGATMLILSIAIAALAVTMGLACAGLYILGNLATIGWAVYGWIWAGVGVFILLALPILALGAAIALFGIILIDKLGLNPGRILMIAASFIILAAAISILAAEFIVASVALFVLGKSYKVAIAAYGWIWAGVLAFMLLAAPVLALGAAVALFGVVLIDKLGLTPGRIFMITASFIILAAAVSILAAEFIVASAALIVLAAFGVAAFFLAPFIWAGVAAFVLLAAPVLALGAAIAFFGTILIDKLGLTPGRIFMITASFITLAFAVSVLAAEFIVAAAALIVLAAFGVAAFFLAPFIWAGVGAFVVLAAPILALGAVIAEFGEYLIDDLELTPSRTKAISETFSSLTTAISDLSEKMIEANADLALLGVLAIFALFMQVSIWAGVFAFWLLMQPLKELAKSMVTFGSEIDKEGLENAADSCDAIAKTIHKLPPVFDALMNGLYPLTQGTWWNDSVIQKILDMRWTIFWALLAISSFLKWGIILPIKVFFGDPEDLDDVAKQCDSMAKAIKSLPPVFEALMNGLLPLTDEGFWPWSKSPLQKIKKLIPIMEEAFPQIAEFLQEGIIQPILNNFGEPADLEKAAKVCDGMATALTSIPPVINALSGPLADLVKPGWFSDSPIDQILTDLIPVWRGNFIKILEFISEGIVDPIFGKGAGASGINLNPTDIAGAAQAMKAIADMLPAIPPVIEALSGPIAKLAKPGFFSGKNKLQKILEKLKPSFRDNFIQILEFISEGIVDPIFGKGAGASGINLNPTDIAGAAQAMKAIADMLPAIPPVIDALNGPIARLNRVGWSGQSKFGKVLENMTEGFRETFIKILRFISHGIIDPIYGIGIGAKGINLNPQDIAGAAQAMKAIADMLPAIPPVIDALNGPIARLNRVGWSGQSKFGKVLENMTEGFRETFIKILRFISHGIIDPIYGIGTGENINLNPQDIAGAAQALKAISDMVALLPGFISELGWRINAIMFNPWLRQKMASIEEFASWFSRISGYLTNGMIIPIRTVFPKTEEIADVQDRLNGMNQVIEKLPAFLMALSANAEKTLAVMNDDKAFNDGAIKIMSKRFGSIALWLNIGVIWPISAFPAPAQLDVAIEKLNKIGNIMDMLPLLTWRIADAAAAVVAFTKSVGFWSIFGLGTKLSLFMFEVGFLSRFGILNPIKSWPTTSELTAAVERLNTMKEMFEAMADAMKGIANAVSDIAQANENLKSIDLPLLNGTSTININTGAAGDAGDTGGVGAAGDATSLLKEIADYLRVMSQGSLTGGGVKMTAPALENKTLQTKDVITKTSGKIEEATKNSGEATSGAVSGLGTQFTTATNSWMQKVMELGKSTPLGGDVPGAGMPHSIPAARVNTEPVQAAHTASTNADIQSNIWREQATATHPGTVPGTTQNTKDLEGAVTDGNVTLDQIRGILQQLLQAMTPKSGGTAGASKTKNQSANMGPSTFARSPFSFNAGGNVGGTNLSQTP